MSTFTSRLNLEKPDPSESMALGDNVLSDNYQKIDAAMGSTVDSGEPPAPYEGMIWSSRDTDLTTKFFKSGWQTMGAQSLQRGFSAYDVDGTVRQASNAVVDIIPVTFAAKLGRLYWIEWNVFYKWVQPALGTFAFYFYNQTDSVLAHQRNVQWYGGTVLPYGQCFQAGFEYEEVVGDRSITMMFQVDTTNAPGLDLQLNTGSNQLNILVHDWGKA